MTNRSPNTLPLIQTDRWLGHLHVPLHILQPGNDTHVSVLEIRGFRSTEFATGVTYALCFALHALRLNIYLQVGYVDSNYFGWTLNETTTCDQAKIWYEKKQYDHGIKTIYL